MASISLRTITRAGVLGLALLGAIGQTGCSTNPTTGRSQFNVLSRSQEIAIGEEAQPQLTSEFGGEVPSSDVQAYMTMVGQRLTTFTESEGNYEELPWEFTVLESDVINAFALPGGKVFISKGLAVKLENEAQFAFIIGHEIGHVTARHANEGLSRQLALQGFATGLGLAVGSSSAMIQTGADLLVQGAAVGSLTFGRKQELEADSLGMRYMAEGNYNPIGAQQAMSVLLRESQGGARPPEFLSTHPHPETRLKAIEKAMTGPYENWTDPNAALGTNRYRDRMLKHIALGDDDRLGVYAMAGAHPAWCLTCAAAGDEQ